MSFTGNKLTIVVLNDQRMTTGRTASVVAEAMSHTLLSDNVNDAEYLSEWYSDGQRHAILQVPTERSLTNILIKAIKNNVNVYPITMPLLVTYNDHETKYKIGDRLVAVVLGPDKSKNIAKITGSLKLL